MEPSWGLTLMAASQAVAKVMLASRTGEEAFGKRSEVEAGSAGDDEEMVALGDFAEGGAGLAGVVAGGEGVVGGGDVDEVMGDEGALGERRLGGAEVHAAVDGYGVATDDFAVELLGEGEGKCGFAAAGGAEDEDGQRVLWE